MTIEPFAGAAAILIHQNGFTEAGGTSALTASARDFNIQTTTLGVRGELTFASMPLTVKTMLGWRNAYGDVVPSVLLAFQGGAQSFGIAGVPIDRDAFVAEAGVELRGDLVPHRRYLLFGPVRPARHGQCLQGEREPAVLSE